jgi:hypothetical protein
MGDEDYVSISADIVAAPRGKGAIFVLCGDGVRRWIPRSLIFGPHEKQAAEMVGQIMEMKVFRWFAEKEEIPRMRSEKNKSL